MRSVRPAPACRSAVMISLSHWRYAVSVPGIMVMLRDPVTRLDRGLGRFRKPFDIVAIDRECLFRLFRQCIEFGGLPQGLAAQLGIAITTSDALEFRGRLQRLLPGLVGRRQAACDLGLAGIFRIAAPETLEYAGGSLPFIERHQTRRGVVFGRGRNVRTRRDCGHPQEMLDRLRGLAASARRLSLFIDRSGQSLADILEVI